ncbi:ABC transporter, M_7a subfamily [Candidatus Phycorickettsia trachydisci]|uniref:ABC transporter, M_7a subfamily n=1 Tax=Candidatus Phycorickettsia trachydisci TaxID=2115978 RepID=A0A2P1P946_9RICK|nr:ABC transporter permease [Candidatus Phycorickettsia trachydisci]AVP87786.1 ABC transporter, M_7a subfamily [Candidatus Phycorickettsia trachydisci]
MLKALIKKETAQILRDPSSIVIAFILPLILLIMYGYGVNFDSNRIRIGLISYDNAADTSSLLVSFADSRFVDPIIGHDKREFEDLLIVGKIKGIVTIPEGFTASLNSQESILPIQLIADGTEPNVASLLQEYVSSLMQNWLSYRAINKGLATKEPLITLEPRYWYNSELKSRNGVVPGSIAVVMTLIGTLLTALVIAREWDRGTMESLLSTPVTIYHLILGKLIPYFVLGLCSMMICFIVATLWYEVPFEGSFLILLFCSAVFLLPALGQGLLISSVTKDQFLAAQIAFITGFQPSFMLSGFMFEISGMPFHVKAATYIVPARYFVTSLQTIFLAGNIWSLLMWANLMMLILGVVFFIFTAKTTVKRLDI